MMRFAVVLWVRFEWVCMLWVCVYVVGVGVLCVWVCVYVVDVGVLCAVFSQKCCGDAKKFIDVISIFFLRNNSLFALILLIITFAIALPPSIKNPHCI